ncbi:MAG TPA: hypothetical protein VIR98_02500 [Candidatus Paceibacterota bacterium]|jgi:hypothetical protein
MKSSSYKPLGTLLVVLAFGLLCAWIFILWQSASLRTKVEEASAQISEAAAKETYLITLKKALIDARESVGELDRRFVPEDGVPAFIDMFEARLSSSGSKAALGTVSLDDPAEGSHIRSLRLRVSGTGTWNEAMALVSSLESMESLLSIRSLSLVSSENDSGKKTWGVSADLSQYVLTKQE